MDNINEIAGRDERISEVFYFFEALTTLASGRTVGRKIGVVQEVLLRWYLEDDEELHRRMYLEQHLEGASGAAHKVEFSWFALHAHENLSVGDEIPGTDGLLVRSADPATERIRVAGPWGGNGVWMAAETLSQRKGPLRNHLDEHGLDLRLRSVEEGATVDVVDRRRLLASLESKRVGAQRFSGSEKLGSGIQTIEKAKQASLVAIDLDIQHNGSVKPLQDPGAQKRAISVVALGNGIHWTNKDRAVLATYVDYTYLVKDSAIIRYAEYVQDLSGDDEEEFLEFFMSYFQGMTKQERDDFDVTDDDFEIVAPEGEERPLRQVLRDHIETADV